VLYILVLIGLEKKYSIQLTEKPCGATKCEKKEISEKKVVCINYNVHRYST